MHYKALTEIFLLSVVMPSVESDKLHKKVLLLPLMISATADMKFVTTRHHHHC